MCKRVGDQGTANTVVTRAARLTPQQEGVSGSPGPAEYQSSGFVSQSRGWKLRMGHQALDSYPAAMLCQVTSTGNRL